MKKINFLTCLSFVIISFLILNTCASKKKEEEKIPELENNTVIETTEESISEESPIERTGRKDNENSTTRETFKLEQVDEQEITSSYTIGSQKYLSFLPHLPGSSIQPEDFNIGGLYNEGTESEEIRLIAGIVSDFLDSMKKNKIKTSLLYDGEESGLYRLLVFHLENTNIPQKYRIGTITIEDIDAGNVIIRIFGEKGRTDGEIYVRKKKDKWYISDMQINFYELEAPVEKSGEKFMPTTYHWMIQGM